ncbi:MAG: hypothetical protein ACFB03_11480 [Paracoccaceae bacterium]
MAVCARAVIDGFIGVRLKAAGNEVANANRSSVALNGEYDGWGKFENILEEQEKSGDTAQIAPCFETEKDLSES